MAKSKKKSVRRAAPKASLCPAPTLAPRILEEAAQGWLQSSGGPAPVHPPARTSPDHRLTEALTETLRELRTEISELRSRLDRLETR